MTAIDDAGPPFVAGQVAASGQLGQLGAQLIEVALVVGCPGRGPVLVGPVDEGDGVAGIDDVAHPDQHLPDDPRTPGHHRVLHLHGLESREGMVIPHLLPGNDSDRQHGAGDGRHDLALVGCLDHGGEQFAQVAVQPGGVDSSGQETLMGEHG
ncbi:MAG: hypothetical protein M3Y36_07315 [Actinomycetota bacterium]|nr:hypothetical protein [Actinomycetota bacterium]